MSAWDSDGDTIRVDVEGAIAVIRFNRPDRQNAWTPEMGEQYFAALERSARAPEVRAIVVTGEGRSFCAGADAAALGKFASGATFAPNPNRPPHWLPLRIGKPIIAAINGACAGIGLQQALCADIRFAGEGAKIATAYSRRGLIGEVGISWLLPRIVGMGHATDLLISGRTITATEALGMGLVSRVVPDADLLEAAMDYARDLVTRCSPRSMSIIKQQLHADMISDLPSAYGRDKTLLPEAFASPDVAEGVKSWLEKRPPEFPPLPEGLAMGDEAAFHASKD